MAKSLEKMPKAASNNLDIYENLFQDTLSVEGGNILQNRPPVKPYLPRIKTLRRAASGMQAGHIRAHGPGMKKGANAKSACAFEEPDTRHELLPLLPFGPDGVGSNTAARLPLLQITGVKPQVAVNALNAGLKFNAYPQRRQDAVDNFLKAWTPEKCLARCGFALSMYRQALVYRFDLC